MAHLLIREELLPWSWRRRRKGEIEEMTGVATETGIIETEKIEGRQEDGTMMIETEIEEEEDDTAEMMIEETEENQDGVVMMTEEIEIAEIDPRMLEADSRTWRREAVEIPCLCWICRIFPNLMEREDLVSTTFTIYTILR